MTGSTIDFDSPQLRPVVQFLHLWTALTHDVVRLQQLGASGELTFRRAYVRAVFAFIEGIVFGLKQQALANPIVELTVAERNLLGEEAFELDERGEPRVRIAFLKLEPNIKFAFAMYAKAAGTQFVLAVGDAGWADLKVASRVRNRLMHPKASDDLTVSDREMSVVDSGYHWFVTQHQAMLKSLAAAILRRSGATDAQISNALSTGPFEVP